MNRNMARNPTGDPLIDRRVILGVSGSIAAYKALTIAGRLTAAGAEVDVIMTRGATRLVQPMSFQAVTHRPVVTSLWEPVGPMALDHVSMAGDADVLVVAPATAHLLARLALGLADDALTTTALATQAPMLLAPAMEPNMWLHAATSGHVATLVSRGVWIVGPEPGRMASGKIGVGRMTDPEGIVEHVRLVLTRGGDLAGKRVVVTAGPTREYLDPVRFLTNRSSGRMGYHLARAARDRGAEVVLISGPVAIRAPVGVTLIPVETAIEMCDAVVEQCRVSDALVMAAAVSDYRPSAPSDKKMKKGESDVDLNLSRNPDILLTLEDELSGRDGLIRIGFAAETEDVIDNARDKLERKHLDLVVANTVPSSFGGEICEAGLVDADGATPLGPRTKADLAAGVVDRLVDLLRQLPSRAPDRGEEGNSVD